MTSMNQAPRWIWAFFLIALTSPFWSLGHALIEVDDARYAEVPREMAETGDWGTPTLDYMPYVEKPPLFYWMAAASYKVFGVSEAAARLPLAVLAALGALLTAWLGSFLYEPKVGLAGAVTLASGTLFFFLAHYITLDMGLTVMLLGVTAMALRCAARPEDGRWAAPAAWVFAALAFLAKGLVALLLPGVWIVALALLAPRWRPGLRCLLRPLGPALFAVIALPWFFLMEHRHPGFFRFIFLEQHFQRFLTPKYNRVSPWYFFILVLPAGLLPWTPALLPTLFRRPRRWLDDPADLALGLWAAIVTAFFSASHSKLATYILPVVPHLALLSARAMDRQPPAWSRKLSMGLGAALVAGAWTAPHAPKVPPEALPWGQVTLASLGLGLIVFGTAKSAALRFRALAVGGFAAGAAALLVLRQPQPMLTARPIAQAIMIQAKPGDAVWSYGIYLQGLPFYLRRRVDKVVNWVGELHYAQRDPSQAARFGDDNDISGLPLRGKRAFVVLRGLDARHFISLTPPGAISDHGLFGRWELAEFLSAEELSKGSPGRAGPR